MLQKKTGRHSERSNYSHEGNKLKNKKQNLKQLDSEVIKSRLAVQSINNNRASETHHNRIKFQELQKELTKEITSIIKQQRKQEILNQLIALLKGEMSMVQKEQKACEEESYLGYEKHVKKIEYDIKQILHKHNEQIAKINTLKDLTDSARSERVVFSNLFKKIEKEIKQDEERYKELLLKNEMMLENKRRPRRGEGLKEENDVFEGTIVDGFNEFNIVPEEDGKDHGLIVNNRSGKNKVYKHEDKQNSTPKVQVQRQNINRANQSQNNTQISYQIKEKEAQISAILIQADCRNVEELVQLHKSLPCDNEKLLQEIQTLSQKIELVQQQTKKVQCSIGHLYLGGLAITSKRGNQIDKENTKEQQKRQKRAKKNLQQSNSKYKESKILAEICQIINLNQQNQPLNDDLLREVDARVSLIGRRQYRKKRQSLIIGDDVVFEVDRHADEILSSIDRFQASQKIYDRSQFQQEYLIEIGKVRVRTKTRK